MKTILFIFVDLLSHTICCNCKAESGDSLTLDLGLMRYRMLLLLCSMQRMYKLKQVIGNIKLKSVLPRLKHNMMQHYKYMLQALELSHYEDSNVLEHWVGKGVPAVRMTNNT